MKPHISIIIPYYNGQLWLPISAASVLAQKGVELELLVVDDGSSAPVEPSSIPSDPRVRLLRIFHAGKGAAINAGIRASSGDIICVLDQDDRMLPGRLERQVAALDAAPDADAVYSDYERIAEDGSRIDVFISRQANASEMLHAMAGSTGLFSMQTLVVRKTFLESFGGFSEDPALTGLDDGEFFVRLIVSGAELIYSPGVATQWVRHAGNYSGSRQFQEARLEFLKSLEAFAKIHPLVRAELRWFRAHIRLMRGLYFLENGIPGKAPAEFLRAAASAPLNWNVYYLLLKALYVSARAAGGEK